MTCLIDGNFFVFSKMYTNKKVENLPKFSQKTAINFSKVGAIWRKNPRKTSPLKRASKQKSQQARNKQQKNEY